MNKWDIKDWLYDYDKEIKRENIFTFRSRMIGFDEENHSNKDFLEWWKFYAGPKDNGYGDGIIPYIDDYCLRYKADFSIRVKDFGLFFNISSVRAP